MTSPISLNTFEIRKQLIQQLLADPSLFRTCQLHNDVYWLYNYYTELELFNLTIKKEFLNKYPDAQPVYRNGSLIPELNAKSLQDTSRCRLHVTVVAWLTLEEDWNWNNIIPDAPKDLQYGLVLDYPSPILRGAAYLLDNNSENYDDASIGYVQGGVITFLQENYFPYMLEIDIIREVSRRQIAEEKTK